MKQVLSHNFRDTCLPNVSKVTHERSWDPSDITKSKQRRFSNPGYLQLFICVVLFCFACSYTIFYLCKTNLYKKWIADVFKVILSWQWNSRRGEAEIDVPFPREKLFSDLLTPAQWTEKQFLWAFSLWLYVQTDRTI